MKIKLGLFTLIALILAGLKLSGVVKVTWISIILIFLIPTFLSLSILGLIALFVVVSVFRRL